MATNDGWQSELKNMQDGSPKEKLAEIFADDAENVRLSADLLTEPLASLDSLLALLFEAFQKAYATPEQWQHDDAARASVAMLISGFNSLLLARHAVLLGYYPESHGILRDVHERSTRALLFYANPDEAKKFMRGKQLDQLKVDERIFEAIVADDRSELDDLFKDFRKKYGNRSRITHPNLEQVAMRSAASTTGATKGEQTRESARTLALAPRFGGITGDEVGRVALFDIMKEAFELLAAVWKTFRDADGSLTREYRAAQKLIEVEADEIRKLGGE